MGAGHEHTGARTRRTWRRAPLALVALVVVAAGCYSVPENRPRPIPGFTNGQLPAHLLVTVSPTCRGEARAGSQLRGLLDAAHQAGYELEARECYRDYAGQVYWRNYWCNRGNCGMAAVPGTSIHGWGKAVDLGVAGEDLTFQHPVYVWLRYYAWIWGWNHPGWAMPGSSTEEPWHWEWVGDGGTLYPDGEPVVGPTALLPLTGPPEAPVAPTPADSRYGPDR